MKETKENKGAVFYVSIMNSAPELWSSPLLDIIPQTRVNHPKGMHSVTLQRLNTLNLFRALTFWYSHVPRVSRQRNSSLVVEKTFDKRFLTFQESWHHILPRISNKRPPSWSIYRGIVCTFSIILKNFWMKFDYSSWEYIILKVLEKKLYMPLRSPTTIK